MSLKRYLTAAEATERLGISRSTLYAYVSRGMIQSEPTSIGSRDRRYLAEDVEALLKRKIQRQGADFLAHNSTVPTLIIQSSISLITNDKLYYRGLDATELALRSPFERVVLQLWLDKPELADEVFANVGHIDMHKYEMILLHTNIDGADLPILQAMQMVLPIAVTDDVTAYDLYPTSIVHTSARILRLLTQVIAGEAPLEQSIAQTLQQHWLPDYPATQKLLDIVLVLCAEHGLDSASFAGRVAAFSLSNPYAVVMACMAVYTGNEWLGFFERVKTLFTDVTTAQDAQTMLTKRLRRGEGIPGFRHPQYVHADPRGQAILTALAQYDVPNPEALRVAQAIQKVVFDTMGLRPSVGFALVTLSKVLLLPEDSVEALFAIARTAGWLAHALEQYESEDLLLPKVNYDGRIP